MRRSKAAWADHTDAPILAAGAYLLGDEEVAVEQLRLGIERLRGVPVLAHACRRQLGVLLGGDEGRALLDQSEAFFRAGGAADSRRIACVLIPGFADLDE
jgi:hypothetical protein